MNPGSTSSGTPTGSNHPESAKGGQGVFVTTHWSLVLAAQTGQSARSAEALEALCKAYWHPLYAFARASGKSPADAEDLTQGFFTQLLQKDYLRSAAQDKGRFRTFLLVAFKRFAANEWDRQHAQKRGGFAEVLSIDQDEAEARLDLQPAREAAPDVLFDRQWALTLLQRTMKALQEEYLVSGRARLFESLQACLGKGEESLSYAQIAAQLNLTEAAVKMAVHRLRARYREILRAEIAQTVAGSAEVEAEIQHLFAAFG